jgi:hypothetical protein
MNLEIEREFQRWGEAEEASYFDELNAKAKAILDSEDIQYRPASRSTTAVCYRRPAEAPKNYWQRWMVTPKPGDVNMNCLLLRG